MTLQDGPETTEADTATETTEVAEENTTPDEITRGNKELLFPGLTEENKAAVESILKDNKITEGLIKTDPEVWIKVETELQKIGVSLKFVEEETTSPENESSLNISFVEGTPEDKATALRTQIDNVYSKHETFESAEKAILQFFPEVSAISLKE